MTELDKAVQSFKAGYAAEKRLEKAYAKHYCGDFKSRSGLSDKDFQNRKSAGRYSNR